MLSRLLTFLCLLFLSQASFPQQSRAQQSRAQQSRTIVPDGVPESCRVTKQSEKPFVAPAPYPAQAPKGSFWFGTDGLWTLLLTNPRWPMGQKTFWWRQDWLGYESDIPEREASRLKVTALRLDGPASPAKIWRGLGGYREDWKSFLVGGIDFPTPGCWEISARYEDNELTYVVWAAK